MSMNHLHVGAGSPLIVQAAAAALLFVHIGGGAIGIVSGMAAVAARKGGRLHRLAGSTFFVSMLAMTLIGGLVAPFLVSKQGEPKVFDSLAGFFTFYLVLTAWMTVKRKAGTIGRGEAAALGFVLLLVAAALLSAGRAAGSAIGLFGGYPAKAYCAFAVIFALAAAFDAKVISRRGITGSPRMARHAWRMCLALFVAAGSFFLGQQRVMPDVMRGSSWLLIPPLVPLAAMIFWLPKLRFGKLVDRLQRKLRPARLEAAAAPQA